MNAAGAPHCEQVHAAHTGRVCAPALLERHARSAWLGSRGVADRDVPQAPHDPNHKKVSDDRYFRCTPRRDPRAPIRGSHPRRALPAPPRTHGRTPPADVLPARVRTRCATPPAEERAEPTPKPAATPPARPHPRPPTTQTAQRQRRTKRPVARPSISGDPLPLRDQKDRVPAQNPGARNEPGTQRAGAPGAGSAPTREPS